MGLMEQIKTEAAKTRNTGHCKAGVALAAMNAKDRADVEEAMADATIPGTVISRVLREAGYDLDPRGESVQRHRRGDCACPR